MIFARIKRAAPVGTRIPKPFTSHSKVSKFDNKRGRPALIYTIRNLRDPSDPYKKGITDRDFELAHNQLLSTGELSRAWFNEFLSECAAEGACIHDYRRRFRNNGSRVLRRSRPLP